MSPALPGRAGFFRSLGFAALAAALQPAAVAALGVSPPASLLLTLVAYVVVIAPGRGRALAAAGLALLLGGACLALPLGPDPRLVGYALALAVCRSGLLYRSPGARALALEVGLGAASLAAAALLRSPDPAGLALATWGFFLVQSLFFLVGGLERRPAAAPGVDPFERARCRALSLLDEGPPLGD